MKHEKMIHLTLAAALVASMGTTAAAAGPTEAQRCEASVEIAAGKLADCRLLAESGYAKTGDATKRADALARCTSRFASSFAKAVAQNGPGDCPSTPQAAFASHLEQCTDEVTAVAHGAAFAGCGDGAVNVAGEQCDGADLDGQSCASLGFLGGTLACGGTCGFDSSGCATHALAATGQTSCSDATGVAVPCTGTGQDGELRAGAASAFTDDGNGTIRDANTGLVWEKLSDDGSIHDKDPELTWAGAFARVAALNAAAFAGYTDWRMPNLRELESLIDYGATNPAIAPAFDTGCSAGCTVTACSCTKAGFTWTSTTKLDVPSAAWGVSFVNGQSFHQIKPAAWSTRAVRGGPV